MPRQRVAARRAAASRSLSPSNQQKSDATKKTKRKAPPQSTAAKIGQKLDAYPDRVDIRDWFYQATLAPLPAAIDNRKLVPDILDQKNNGACTGFALAAVINFHLARHKIKRTVSPHMLYEMARKYDEWPGQNYEGSSARGAMIGWVRHGVCSLGSWPQPHEGSASTVSLGPLIVKEARGTPGGAYYRVQHRQVRDMHAALYELGILYCTLMVHSGWEAPSAPDLDGLSIPVIRRQGRADEGHAVALVGYTKSGFIVQNSWGPHWAAGGYALLPYEDFMMHATDVWAAQLGVPVSVDLWDEEDKQYTDSTKGISRASNVIPLDQIRPYVIDCGNDGQLSQTGNYWTTEADVKRLFDETIPTKMRGWKRHRVMLYLHGGLNSEEDVARRIVAFRDVMLENEIYPVHVMWESGAFETLKNLIDDFLKKDARAGGAADWLTKAREGLQEAWDRTLEFTVALPGTAFWKEMKENAELASDHPAGPNGEVLGAMQIVANYAAQALAPVANKKEWELHIVAHSAGSIYTAFALALLLKLGVNLASVQFMAPAITVDLFKRLILPSVKSGDCPQPTVYVLSDQTERADTVGAYGKSLLYLVSNSFEGKRNVELLGMQKFISDATTDAQGNRLHCADPVMDSLFKKSINGEPSLVVAGSAGDEQSKSQSRSHGGFDNDVDTMNSVLRRIVGRTKLDRAFDARDLQY